MMRVLQQKLEGIEDDTVMEVSGLSLNSPGENGINSVLSQKQQQLLILTHTQNHALTVCKFWGKP